MNKIIKHSTIYKFYNEKSSKVLLDYFDNINKK